MRGLVGRRESGRSAVRRPGFSPGELRDMLVFRGFGRAGRLVWRGGELS